MRLSSRDSVALWEPRSHPTNEQMDQPIEITSPMRTRKIVALARAAREQAAREDALHGVPPRREHAHNNTYAYIRGSQTGDAIRVVVAVPVDVAVVGYVI